MKQMLLLSPLLAIFVLALSACKSTMKTADTSVNSLDWQGTYHGVIPCADCAGIITSITLNNDNTYRRQMSYRGKSEEVFTNEGRFEWNEQGNTIKLAEAGSEGSSYYKVGENRLIQLDREGNEISGNLSSLYILQKQQEGIVNKYWKLVEVNGQPVSGGTNGRREPHMILHLGDMRVTGHGGCNNFTGSYDLKENQRIKFSSVAATKMYCEGASETESQFFRALEIADNYHIAGDKLQLFRGRMAPLARFEAVYLR